MRFRTFIALSGASLLCGGWTVDDVQLDVPAVVSEGGEATVGIFAPPGAQLILQWELDEDFDFDDAWTESAVFSAEDRDGPTAAVVSLRVADIAGNETYLEAPIAIGNVAPTIVSDPILTARVGFQYEYRVDAVDPGSEDDTDLRYALQEEPRTAPDGMVVTEDGRVQWTPVLADLDDEHLVRFHVFDKDGGVATQTYLLRVVENGVPQPVTAAPALPACLMSLQPTLTVYNSLDPEGDVLVYFFEVSEDPAFATTVASSPAVLQQLGGFTEWTVSTPLEPGSRYFWRAWATDSVSRSEATYAEVCIREDADEGPVTPAVDADLRGPELRYGCAASATPARAPSFDAALGLGLVLFFARRRR